VIVFCSDLFVEHINGGAELTSDAIIKSSKIPIVRLSTLNLTIRTIQQYKNHFWIFGNYKGLKKKLQFHIAKTVDYAVLEYDYKYCKYRSPEFHQEIENKECDCEKTEDGKVAAIFLRKARAAFWMSKAQLDYCVSKFPFLKDGNNIVLNSVLSEETLDKIEAMDCDNKSETWGIIGSTSWIKGVQEAIDYAKKKGLKYKVLSGLTHDKCLEAMSKMKGLIFKPLGKDTCPRITMEAKLLGCDLDLNENVQHKGEEWFKTKESCLEHLRKRTDVFWREVEKHMDFLTSFETKQKTHFKIIVPFYNAGKWLKKCIKTIKTQNYSNFECYLIDDMSEDESVSNLKKEIGNDKRFTLVQNKTKKWALNGIADAIKMSKAAKEDVVILLDGDDWFASDYVLSYLDYMYDEKEYWTTYGSYVMHPHGIPGPEPSKYPDKIVDNNDYRKDVWRASHLRTFKNHLWERIKDEDLRDQEGEYFKMAYDQAVMLPVLEMAGNKAFYCPKILHVYNRQNPLNVDKLKAMEQKRTADFIRTKEKYERIL